MEELSFDDDTKGLEESFTPSEKPCHSWVGEVFSPSPVPEACLDVTLNNNSSCDSKRQTMEGITKVPSPCLPLQGWQATLRPVAWVWDPAAKSTAFGFLLSGLSKKPSDCKCFRQAQLWGSRRTSCCISIKKTSWPYIWIYPRMLNVLLSKFFCKLWGRIKIFRWW